MDENIYVNIPVGPSGCGKTSLAIEQIHLYPDMVIISKDKLREMFYGQYAYKHSYEEMVSEAASYLIMCALANGHSLFIDETNLTLSRREELLKEVGKFKKMSFRPVKIIGWYFKIGESFVDKLIKTRFKENKGVEASSWKKVIMDQVSLMTPPQREEGFDVIHVIDRDKLTDQTFAQSCYLRQKEFALRMKTVVLAPESGVCPKCKESIWTVENVARSYNSLVTGCPFCGYSFC